MRCDVRRPTCGNLLAFAILGTAALVPVAFAHAAPAVAAEHEESVDDAAPMLPDEEVQESELSFASDEPGQLPDDPGAEEMPSELAGDVAGEGPAIDEQSPTEAGLADGEPAPLKLTPGDELPQELAPAETDEVVDAPPIDPAALAGVSPGDTTHEELRKRWGKPLRVQKVAGGVRETYQFGGFERVRATIVEDVVESVAVQLAQPTSAKKLARLLDLSEVEPIDVRDDGGRPLGRAFPERGIMFGYTTEADSPRVIQIILQGVDAEPFLARAQKRLSTRYTDCLADLQQAERLAPANARVYALRAQLAMQIGELGESMKMARKAIDLAPLELEYQLVLAQAQARSGDYATALERLRTIAESQRASAPLRARAYLQWGDCVAASPKRDFSEAMKLHARAIKLVEPVASGDSYTERRAAKEILIDAHLAVAHDIGAGRWQQKSDVIPKWLERAMAMADDLVARDHGEPRVRLRVYEQALAAIAPLAEPPDAGVWIRGATQLGATMLEEASDVGYKARLSWDLAVALSDAVEIEQARKRRPEATELATLAMECFEAGAAAGKELPARDYLRGRLMFRMGELAVTDKSKHEQAISWFDRAVPLLDRAPASVAAMRGRRGEMMVAMAISYWETNQREQALRLTERGAQLMQQAAGEGSVNKAALATPYANLASMHKMLGNGGDARKYSVMAASYQEKVESK